MAIRLESDREKLKEMLTAQRREGRSIGFVPTMGYLHQGHQSLIEASRRDGNFTVVSVFVNPTQFGPNEDLDKYPSDPDGDFDKSVAAGADLVWYPVRTDLYPPGEETRVVPGLLSKALCGLSRPAFFPGICTVVLKLFNLVRPDSAYFGEKDYQQLTIIRKMVDDFFLDLKVVGGATVREPDGLAMSSRNAYLKPEDRDVALTLYRTIVRTRQAFAMGRLESASLRDALLADWPAALELDYLDFRDGRTLENVTVLDENTRVFLGAWLRGIRLIDNASVCGRTEIAVV